MKARLLLLCASVALVSCAGGLSGLSVAYEREVAGLPVLVNYTGGKASVAVMWPWIDKLQPTGQK